LLRAKLGDRYREASAAFIWAIIARMYAARRTGLKKEMFGYAAGGYATILERFANTLTGLGVEIRAATSVTSIAPQPGGGLVVTAAGGSERCFDQVVSTAPAPAVIAQCSALTPREKEKLGAVRYQGIICTSLLSKVALSPYYVTNITDPVPFSAVIEMSALVDRTEFRGMHLIYVPKYLAVDDPLFDDDDAAIEQRFLGTLEKMYPHFQRSDAVAFKVSRVRNVMPIPALNYSRNVLDFQTSVPGFSVVNSTQIVNGTLNVNETIALAERAARVLITSRNKTTDEAALKTNGVVAL
jgi:protoporphyrinogen oxidase